MNGVISSAKNQVKEEVFFARFHSYNPVLRHVRRVHQMYDPRYPVEVNGARPLLRFEAGKVYRVDRTVAEILVLERNDTTDPTSPAVFEIMRPEQFQMQAAQEAAKHDPFYQARLEMEQASDLTTEALRRMSQKDPVIEPRMMPGSRPMPGVIPIDMASGPMPDNGNEDRISAVESKIESLSQNIADLTNIIRAVVKPRTPTKKPARSVKSMPTKKLGKKKVSRGRSRRSSIDSALDD